jgi:DNA-binding MarR family transcriptional regulator
LSKLEWAGYVHVRPDWDDARRKLVVISPAGRLARDTALEAISPMVDDLIGDLGADRVRAVLPILRELRGKLE